MQSAFGIVHPSRVRKSSPRLKKVSKGLVTGLFRGGAAGQKVANSSLRGVRAGAPVATAAEQETYRAAQLKRMKDSTTGSKGKELVLRPKASPPVAIRAPKPRLAIEGPKPGAPRNLPAVRRGPVTVPERPLAVRQANTSSNALVPTRVAPKGSTGGSGASGGAPRAPKAKKQRSNPFAGVGDKVRGKFTRVRKPAGEKPAKAAGSGNVRNVQVSPLAATAIGAGVAGGGYLAGQGIRAGLAERKQKEGAR